MLLRRGLNSRPENPLTTKARHRPFGCSCFCS